MLKEDADPGSDVLHFENFRPAVTYLQFLNSRLLFRHGRPSQQLLSSCYLSQEHCRWFVSSG